jgi:hypothetical protein
LSVGRPSAGQWRCCGRVHDHGRDRHGWHGRRGNGRHDDGHILGVEYFDNQFQHGGQRFHVNHDHGRRRHDHHGILFDNQHEHDHNDRDVVHEYDDRRHNHERARGSTAGLWRSGLADCARSAGTIRHVLLHDWWIRRRMGEGRILRSSL